MNSIIPFDFETLAVRVVMTENAEPWFVAADVCQALGIKNHKDAVSRLESDEKGVGTTDTLGGKQELLTINESGLYALIFRSRKDSAKRFRKWVTAEVLPTLRRTGQYGTELVAEGQSPEDMAIHGRSQRIIEHRRVFMEFKRLVTAASSMSSDKLEMVNTMAEQVTGIDTVGLLQQAGWNPPKLPNANTLEEHAIKQWLLEQPGDNFTGGAILQGALSYAPEDIGNAELTRVGIIMRRLGWRKVRRKQGNSIPWLYQRPKDQVAA